MPLCSSCGSFSSSSLCRVCDTRIPVAQQRTARSRVEEVEDDSSSELDSSPIRPRRRPRTDPSFDAAPATDPPQAAPIPDSTGVLAIVSPVPPSMAVHLTIDGDRARFAVEVSDSIQASVALASRVLTAVNVLSIHPHHAVIDGAVPAVPGQPVDLPLRQGSRDGRPRKRSIALRVGQRVRVLVNNSIVVGTIRSVPADGRGKYEIDDGSRTISCTRRLITIPDDAVPASVDPVPRPAVRVVEDPIYEPRIGEKVEYLEHDGSTKSFVVGVLSALGAAAAGSDHFVPICKLRPVA